MPPHTAKGFPQVVKSGTLRWSCRRGGCDVELKLKRGTYFVEKEKKKEETLSSTCNEKVLTSLYWLCKQKVAHSKLNSLLELLESLGVDEVPQFSKGSSTVIRELLLIIGNQMKEDLLEKIKKVYFFGILTDGVTDISNIQNLVTFIEY